MTKDRIKDRMKKNAARMWGIPENEIDSNFDPLIMLLIEACASELELIDTSISSSQDRMLEKLADLIVPESLTGPKPASGLAVATPIDTHCNITEKTEFFVPQNLMNNETGTYTQQKCHFTPIGNFKLLKAKLVYTMIGNKLFKLNGNSNKELIYTKECLNNHNKINEIWLAIAPDKNLTTLKDLNISFDLGGHSIAKEFYKKLPQAKANFNQKEIILGNGFSNSTQFELDGEAMLKTGYEYAKKLNIQIASIYKEKFVHILEDINTAETIFPEELNNMIPENIISKLKTEPCIYLKIILDKYYLQEDINELNIAINSFPIINRKFHTTHYASHPWINIVPIKMDGHFLDMHNIESIDGEKYKFKNTANTQQLTAGFAMLRSSGVGKKSSREVRDDIANLVEAIHDNSAYFSETSNDFITSRLKEISIILSRLDEQIQKSKDVEAAKQFVLLKPKKEGDTITIQHWSTEGEIANQIKAGTHISTQNNTIAANNDMYLITNSVGARNRVSDGEKKSLLKQQILSAGKIISVQDVKMLAVQIFGENLKQVVVEKTTTIGQGISKGYTRVIQIKLLLKTHENNVPYLCKEMETILQEHGSFNYPFQVLVHSN